MRQGGGRGAPNYRTATSCRSFTWRPQAGLGRSGWSAIQSRTASIHRKNTLAMEYSHRSWHSLFFCGSCTCYTFSIACARDQSQESHTMLQVAGAMCSGQSGRPRCTSGDYRNPANVKLYNVNEVLVLISPLPKLLQRIALVLERSLHKGELVTILLDESLKAWPLFIIPPLL